MVLGSLMAPRAGEEASKWFAWLNTVAFVVAVGAPVLGGYLAARISNVQPLLHGLVVGLLGSIFIAFTSSPGIAGLWAAFVFIPGGIAGGWLRKIERDKTAP